MMVLVSIRSCTCRLAVGTARLARSVLPVHCSCGSRCGSYCQVCCWPPSGSFSGVTSPACGILARSLSLCSYCRIFFGIILPGGGPGGPYRPGPAGAGARGTVYHFCWPWGWGRMSGGSVSGGQGMTGATQTRAFLPLRQPPPWRRALKARAVPGVWACRRWGPGQGLAVRSGGCCLGALQYCQCPAPALVLKSLKFSYTA